MAQTYEYILKLTDKTSPVISKITGASASAISKLEGLNAKNKALDASTKDFGKSITTLKQKIDLLQGERDLIDPRNLGQIRAYNREIGSLTGQIQRLDKAGTGGGGLKKYFGQLDAAMGGLLTNPLVVGGAAIGASVASAMSFDQGMAKVNITAQLDEKGLTDLRGKLIQMSKDNKTDVTMAPVGFEKIISQVGNVQDSLPILDASLKGSKAGFVDLDVVAGALAQTMSIVGSENTTAQEVLDTFFAAKRVGAGEFADFANYMPTLIAGASNLGVAYKDVAGVFAYMTGKGQKAEKAAVLMENMFSVLGKGDIRKNLSTSGIDVFDKTGKMRDMVSIFGDLKNVTASMNDEQKSSFLERMGIVDKEAKNAIAIMISDTDKLRESISATNNAQGETAKTLRYSKNSMQTAAQVWASFKQIGVDLGSSILPLVGKGLGAMSAVLDLVAPVVVTVVGLFVDWLDALTEGNPLIWVLSTAIGGVTVALNAATIATKAKAFWDSISTGATSAWTSAQWLLNTSLYGCPIVWIIAGVAALVAGVIYAWQNFEGFRKGVMGVWEVLRVFGGIIFDSVIEPIKSLISGLGSVGSALYKLFSGDFKGAWQDAKDGAASLFNAYPIVATVKAGVKIAQTDWVGTYQNGAQKGTDSWRESQGEAGATSGGSLSGSGLSGGMAGALGGASTFGVPGTAPKALTPAVKVTGNGAAAPSGASGGKSGHGTTSGVIDLDKIAPASRKGTTGYGAIAAQFSAVRMASLGVAASMAMAVPLSDTVSMPGAAASAEMAQATSPRGRLSADKFCDQIVINIQKADGQGADEIRRVVMEALNSVLDDGAPV